VTKLKMPAEIAADKEASGKETVEAAAMATTEMAEKAGENPTKVRQKIDKKAFISLIHHKKEKSLYCKCE
jgi:hypothetical protein